MSTQPTLMSMSPEVLLMIFIQVYSAAQIHFSKGLDLEKHRATVTESWVPERLIQPMLICKYLRPFAWQAFLKKTLFILPGRGLNTGRYSWEAFKSFEDPTDLARRVQGDREFAMNILGSWPRSKRSLPNLKDLSIAVTISLQDAMHSTMQPTYYTWLQVLQDRCLDKGIEFNTYLTFKGDRFTATRTGGARRVTQSVQIVIRRDGSASVKEIKDVEKPFYDAAKQFVTDFLGQRLEEIEIKAGAKLIKYVDNEMDWKATRTGN